MFNISPVKYATNFSYSCTQQIRMSSSFLFLEMWSVLNTYIPLLNNFKILENHQCLPSMNDDFYLMDNIPYLCSLLMEANLGKHIILF